MTLSYDVCAVFFEHILFYFWRTIRFADFKCKKIKFIPKRFFD